MVENVEEIKARLITEECEIVKDESDFHRCYVKSLWLELKFDGLT